MAIPFLSTLYTPEKFSHRFIQVYSRILIRASFMLIWSGAGGYLVSIPGRMDMYTIGRYVPQNMIQHLETMALTFTKQNDIPEKYSI